MTTQYRYWELPEDRMLSIRTDLVDTSANGTKLWFAVAFTIKSPNDRHIKAVARDILAHRIEDEPIMVWVNDPMELPAKILIQIASEIHYGETIICLDDILYLLKEELIGLGY